MSISTSKRLDVEYQRKQCSAQARSAIAAILCSKRLPQSRRRCSSDNATYMKQTSTHLACNRFLCLSQASPCCGNSLPLDPPILIAIRTRPTWWILTAPQTTSLLTGEPTPLRHVFRKRQFLDNRRSITRSTHLATFNHESLRRQQVQCLRQGTFSPSQSIHSSTTSDMHYHQTVLLTGASEGMGKSVAMQLARKGASIIIVSRSVAKLEAALKDITVRLSALPPSQRQCLGS